MTLFRRFHLLFIGLPYCSCPALKARAVPIAHSAVWSQQVTAPCPCWATLNGHCSLCWECGHQSPNWHARTNLSNRAPPTHLSHISPFHVESPLLWRRLWSAGSTSPNSLMRTQTLEVKPVHHGLAFVLVRPAEVSIDKVSAPQA